MSTTLDPPVITASPVAEPNPSALRQMLAVASMEIRLSLRAPAFWVLLAVTTVFALAIGALSLAVSVLPSRFENMQSDLNVAIALPLAFFPLLVGRTVARDRARRLNPLIQPRPVATLTYSAGQWLGDLILCLGLLLWMYGLPVALALLQGAISPAAIWPAVWLPGLLTLCLAGLVITSWAMLWTRLIPIPFLGALVAIVSSVYLVYGSPLILTRPLDLPLESAFFSPSIGYGPDAVLVWSQWGMDLGIGLAALAAALLIAHWRDRQAMARPRHWLATGTIGGAAILVLAASLIAFFPQAQLRTAALGPVTDPPLAATISSYHLDVAVDPLSGAFSGTAVFQLNPPSTGAPTLVFALNPGLVVTRATVGGQALAEHARDGWHTLALSGTPLTQGQAAQVVITYHGSLTLPRADYARFSPGIAFVTFSSISVPPVAPQAYAGQGIAFLQAGGDWYPRPWIVGEASRYERGDVFDAVSVSLPMQVQVVHGAGTLTKQANQQIVSLQGVGVLPHAFLVAMDGAQTYPSDNGTIIARGHAPSAANLTLATNLLDGARRLDTWLGGGNRSWQAVIVPLILLPQVAPGLILVPEMSSGGYIDNQFQPDLEVARFFLDQYPRSDTMSTTGQWHAAAQFLTSAWWQSQLITNSQGPFRDGGLDYFNAQPDTTGMATPHRVVFVAPINKLADVLAEYTADVLTGDRFGPAVLAEDITVRRHAQAAQKAELQLLQSAQGDQNVDRTAFIQANEAMYTHGMSLFGTSDSFEQTLALDDLETAIGRPAVTNVLRDYLAAHSASSASLQDFAAFVTQRTGQDFTALLAQYDLSSMMPGRQAGS